MTRAGIERATRSQLDMLLGSPLRRFRHFQLDHKGTNVELRTLNLALLNYICIAEG